ncbi:MAG: hypothetical protein ACFFA4_10865 [Promethearchaeota archaeon]
MNSSRIKEKPEKLPHKSVPPTLCIIGAVVGIIMGLAYQPMFYYWGGHSLHGYYIAGASLVPVLGAIIQLKNLRAGNIICLISGIILVIMSIFPFYGLPFFLIIGGSIYGIYLTRKTELPEDRKEIVAEKENIGSGFAFCLLGGFLGILIGVVDGILNIFSIFIIILFFISLVTIILAIIALILKKYLFIGSIICLISGITLIILLFVGLRYFGYFAFFVTLLIANYGDLAMLIVFFILSIPYLLIIVGGIFVLKEVIKEKKS